MFYAIEAYPLDGLTSRWPSQLAAESARDQIAAIWGIGRHAFRIVAVPGPAAAENGVQDQPAWLPSDALLFSGEVGK